MGVTQNEKAMRFRALHEGPGAFVIPNPWDVLPPRPFEANKKALLFRSG